MKKSLLILLAFLLSATSGAFAQSEYEISVLTCDEDDELYAAFGHTALRVKSLSEDNQADIVFNFGLFDFSTPGFYAKFVRGTLDYLLGAQRYEDFYAEYRRRGISVREQTLFLSDEQKTNILGWLDERIRPENRAYRYKFLTRNCTTEVRDLIFRFTDVGGLSPQAPSGRTYRDYLHHALRNKPWTRYGVDILLGYAGDNEMSVFESMFLPEKFHDGLDQMDNGSQKLVTESATLYDSGKPRQDKRFFVNFYPIIIALAFLALVALRKSRYITFSVFLIIGLLGILLTVVTFYSQHAELRGNLNILWANPLYLALAITYIRGMRKPTLWLSAVCTGCLTAMAVVAILGIQFYPLFFWIITLSILIMVARINFGVTRSGKVILLK